MSFVDFWQSVYRVMPASLRQPGVHTPDVNSITAEEIEKSIEKNIAWFTPRTGAAWEKADFNFLPADECDQLDELVSRFKSVAALARNHNAWSLGLVNRLGDPNSVISFARHWGDKDYAHATSEDLSKQQQEEVGVTLVKIGVQLFRDIILFFEFDRFRDAEAFRLGKLIEFNLNKDWPPELAELRFHSENDHTGVPSLFIWAFITEEASTTEAVYLDSVRKLRPIIYNYSHDIAPDLFPYISFRSVAEEVDEVLAK